MVCVLLPSSSKSCIEDFKATQHFNQDSIPGPNFFLAAKEATAAALTAKNVDLTSSALNPMGLEPDDFARI